MATGNFDSAKVQQAGRHGRNKVSQGWKLTSPEYLVPTPIYILGATVT